MAKQNKLSKYWTGFHKSAEYQECLVYPVSMVKGGIETIFDSLPATIGKWELSDFAGLLGELSNLALNETDTRANQIFDAMYTIITAFLRYLAEQRVITTTPATLAAFFHDYEEQNAILFNPSTDDDLDMAINVDPTLPEWQERTAVSIQSYTADWVTAYQRSAAWQNRPDGVSEAFLTVVLNELVQRGYNYYRKTPKSWSKRVLTDILTTTIITKYEFSAEEYALLVPMLTSFLQFVADQGWLNAKRAADYQRYLQAGEADMIAGAKDYADNPDALEIINQKMVAAGIDPKDPDAAAKFVDELEATGGLAELYEQLYGDKTAEAGQPENDDTAPEIEEVMSNPAAFAGVAQVYDPDKKQTYLTEDHRSINDGWLKKTAISVHSTGVQAGLRLWFQRQNIVLPAGWDAPEVISNVSELTDRLYAQWLVAPNEWTTKIFSQVGQWLKDNRSQADYDDMRTLLTSLITVLTGAGILTTTQGNQLPEALKAGSIAKVVSPKKVKGKVISMKQARKLLKNKKHR